MHTLIFYITLMIYFVSTVGFLVHIITQRKEAEGWALLVLGAGFAGHTVYLVSRWISSGHPPMANLHESLSFLAWSLVAAFLLLQFASKVKSLGAFVTPMATVIMAAAATQSGAIVSLPPALRSVWLPIHASICLVADAVFILAFCISVMYLLQERQIKSKKLGGLFQRLPSLDSLDRMNRRCISFGFPLLTVGIVTGSIWAEQAWGAYWSWDPKETWSLITWFLYAALIHQRLTVGWRGRRAAIMTIFAFAALVFTFLGVSLLLPGAHSYATWFK